MAFEEVFVSSSRFKILLIFDIIEKCFKPDKISSFADFVTIIIYSLESFTSVLADGLLMESKWQQVSSSLQDSSQYTGCSQ